MHELTKTLTRKKTLPGGESKLHAETTKSGKCVE